jgi:hypothetical protein
MNDEPLYNEAWWERELHRNEKLMDRYLAALADNPELARSRQVDDAGDGVESNALDHDGQEDNPSEDEGYAEIARFARRFALAVGSLDPDERIPEILALSAPKVAANLAGGHGLGYDEDTVCGNIVKCRWALADCEFCREMLEQLAQQTGHGAYHSLAAQSGRLSAHLRERIARLRARVWW